MAGDDGAQDPRDQRRDRLMEDPKDNRREGTDIPPEAVGQHIPTEEKNRSGFPGFVGMNLRVWGLAAVIFLLAIVVILVIAIS